jgi:hypothetical protein
VSTVRAVAAGISCAPGGRLSLVEGGILRGMAQDDLALRFREG